MRIKTIKGRSSLVVQWIKSGVVTAVARVLFLKSLAQEFLHATGMAKTKTNKQTNKNQNLSSAAERLRKIKTEKCFSDLPVRMAVVTSF